MALRADTVGRGIPTEGEETCPGGAPLPCRTMNPRRALRRGFETRRCPWDSPFVPFIGANGLCRGTPKRGIFR